MSKKEGEYEVKNRMNIDGIIYEKGDLVKLTEEQKVIFAGSFN